MNANDLHVFEFVDINCNMICKKKIFQLKTPIAD